VKRRQPRPLLWLGGLLAIYLGFPLAAFVVRVIGGGQEGWNVPGLWSALGVSVISASASLLIGVVTGIPLAYILAKRGGRLSGALRVLVQLPLALPPLVTGIILIYIVGPYSFLGSLSGQRLTETIWGLIIAQSFVSIPFLVVVARSAFAAVDPTLDELAATLGHGPLSRFLRVDVPAASDGIRTGMILMWLRAFGEFGTVVILAYHPYSLPVYVDNLFSSGPLSQAEAPTVLAFVVAALAISLSTIHRLPRGLRRNAPKAPSNAVAPLRTAPGALRFQICANLAGFGLQIAGGASSGRVAIVGPSGSGKTLTLRALAGVADTASAAIRYADRDLALLPAEHRRIGYVPQGYGLLPGRTVWDQITFGTDADPQVAAWWLERLAISELIDRYPGQLSGGQRQRVSLARALAVTPELVLLDEPFSALDTPVRAQLRRELRVLQREHGLATVLVTHDPQEAAMLADELVILARGRVLQAGSVREVFRRPLSLEVSSILGLRNVHQGRVTADGTHVRCGHLSIALAERATPDTEVLWAVAAERVIVLGSGYAQRPADPDTHPALPGTVTDLIDLGSHVEVTATLDTGIELTSRTDKPLVSAPGEACLVHLERETIRAWPATAQLPPQLY
jgi:molybdate transport system permease protein